MRLLLFILLLIGCGSPEDKILGPDYEKVYDVQGFETYITSFKRDSVAYGNGVQIDDLIIRFEDIPQEKEGVFTLGTCTYAWNQNPVIRIDPGHWEWLSDNGRLMLVYHELGHCVLKQGHREGFVSIMNPLLPPSFMFEQNREEMLRELFTFKSLDLHEHSGNHVCGEIL